MAPLEIHPSALQSIDQKAQDLLTGISPRPAKSRDAAPNSGRVATNIPLETVDSVIEYHHAPSGVLKEIYFFQKDTRLGIDGSSMTQLQTLLTSLLKISEIEKKLSQQYLTKQIVDWCRHNYGSAEPISFGQKLIGAANIDIRSTSALIPINGLEVEEPFSVSNADVVPVTATLLNEIEAGWSTQQTDPDRVAAIGIKMQQLRQRYQGAAAVLMHVEGEAGRVSEIATDTAITVVALLRLFMPAAYDPRISSSCAVAGFELEGTATALLFGGSSSLIQKLDGPHTDIRFDRNFIAQMKREGLDQLSKLVLNQGLNNFEEKLRQSLLTFSRCTTTPNINDKLVFCLSALEVLLLKDQSEPIQQTVGERIAFLTRQSVSHRREVLKNLKLAYGIRSRYIHHGDAASVDQTVLCDFFINARSLFAVASKNIERFKTKDDFLNAVDNIKFSGTVPSRK